MTTAKPRGADVARAVVRLGDPVGWGNIDFSRITASDPDERTEWHELFFLKVNHGDKHSHINCSDVSSVPRQLVVNLPSWRGAILQNKAAASAFVAQLGLSPQILFEGEMEIEVCGEAQTRYATVCEFLSGGELETADLTEPGVMAQVGRLYGTLHRCGAGDTGQRWFAGSAKALSAEGLLPPGAASWAATSWILPWLQSLVPEENRKKLAAEGVDWDLIASEIAAIPSCELLPASETTTVHGDSHVGNLCYNADGELKLIDFDLTAIGPAGVDLGFIVLMLFRCGFAAELVLEPSLQRTFAQAYLQSLSTTDAADSDSDAQDELLLTMHLWAYVGCLKMGLLCAVLMANDGHPDKRVVMRTRGPTLLHPRFLHHAKRCMQAAIDDTTGPEDGPRAQLLRRGLFFLAEDAWHSEAQ